MSSESTLYLYLNVGLNGRTGAHEVPVAENVVDASHRKLTESGPGSPLMLPLKHSCCLASPYTTNALVPRTTQGTTATRGSTPSDGGGAGLEAVTALTVVTLGPQRGRSFDWVARGPPN